MHPSRVDPARHPALAHYLAGLPHGLDSHPECAAKASLTRQILAARPLELADDLPSVLLDLAAHPPPTSAWIPEVHHRALLMLLYDQEFRSLEAYERFTYEMQLRLWSSRLYAVLLRWTSAPRLLSSVSQRWAQLRRGTTLRCERIEEAGATAVLEFPQGLYDEIGIVGVTAGFRAVMAMSSRHESEVRLLERSDRGARWSVSWIET